MRYCPKCQNKYTDQTLQFCLQDGNPLVDITDESQEAQTVSFEEQETIVGQKHSPEPITFELNNSTESNWGESQVTRVTATGSSSSTRSGISGILLAVGLTALIMLILFGLIGTGVYFYYSGTGDDGLAKNPVANKPEDDPKINKIDEKTPAGDKTPGRLENPLDKKTPAPPVIKDPTPKPEETGKPTPEPPEKTDPAEIKKEIVQRIYTWKSLAESRNLNPYMANYASTLDYYTKRGVSRSFVRQDKQRAFSKYSTIRIQVSNVSVNPSKDGRTAVVNFDKQWLFTGGGGQNKGKVRSQLKFRKVDGRWLITSERDLKVYYVDK